MRFESQTEAREALEILRECSALEAYMEYYRDAWFIFWTYRG